MSCFYQSLPYRPLLSASLAVQSPHHHRGLHPGRGHQGLQEALEPHLSRASASEAEDQQEDEEGNLPAPGYVLQSNLRECRG